MLKFSLCNLQKKALKQIKQQDISMATSLAIKLIFDPAFGQNSVHIHHLEFPTKTKFFP